MKPLTRSVNTVEILEMMEGIQTALLDIKFSHNYLLTKKKKKSMTTTYTSQQV